MKYFLHDTSAFDDEKISELFLNFGYEGLGLFYTFLEKIGKQEKPIKTTVLKSQLKVGKRLDKCWSFMEQIGIVSSSNGESFNKQLLNYSETYQIKKEKTRKKVSEWRERQEDIKSVTSYVPVSNPPKVKVSKVKVSKVNNIDSEFYPFDEFWEDYGKKLDSKKCRTKWDKIPESIRQSIKNYLPEYKSSTPDIQFRKNPETFLNNECWNDPVIKKIDNQPQQPTYRLPRIPEIKRYAHES